MTLERTVMERWFALLQGEEPLRNPLHNRLQVYRDMVRFRYLETLQTLFPHLIRQVGEADFKQWVVDFLGYGAREVLIGEMGGEFERFIHNNARIAKTHPYAADLAWLEWTQANLWRKTAPIKQSLFCWGRTFRLADTAAKAIVHHRVHQGEYETPCVCPIILYRHDQSVLFEEITALGFEALVLLETMSPELMLQTLARRYESETTALRKPIQTLFSRWCEQKILISEV